MTLAAWIAAPSVIVIVLIGAGCQLPRHLTPVRKITNTGAHTARALRDTEDSKTITWLKSLKSRRQPTAVEDAPTLIIKVDGELTEGRYEELRQAFRAAVAKGGHPEILPDVDPFATLPNARAGNWLPAPARPDLDADDTGALPRYVEWAKTAPLSEVRRG